MSQPDSSEEMDTTISPPLHPRTDNSLSFKPPTRPGASLKGRKSTAALSEIDANGQTPSATTAPIQPASFQGVQQFRAPSPASSLEPTSSNVSPSDPPSSNEAQALAITHSARQRLHLLSEQTDTQTTAAGRLGQSLLEQRRKLELMQEELAKVLSDLESSKQSLHDGDNSQKYERIHSLAQKIETEISDMTARRQALLKELVPFDNQTATGITTSDSSQSLHQPFAFLANDPATRTMTATLSKNSGISDLAISPSISGSIPGTASRQYDRRARNAAAPTSIGDQNLVNQLQEGLVTEIRRLQNLLAEREKQLKASDEEKRRSDEELSLWKPKAMALMEREDAMKQESWDLNIQVQDLRVALEVEKAAGKKLEGERTRINKELAKSREVADERKVQLEGQIAELDRLKSLRETETALARKEKATMAREYSDLQSEVTRYKAYALKLERASATRSVSNSLLGPDQTLDEEFEDHAAAEQAVRRCAAAEGGASSPGGFSEDASQNSSAFGLRNAREREVSDLRGKLILAQKKTGKDSAEKRRLRDQNAELRKLLVKAGVQASKESDVESTDDEAQWADEASASSKPPRRANRIPKSSTRPNMASRLGLSPSSLNEWTEDYEESFDVSLAEEHDQSSNGHASADGMDPAFAGDLIRKDRCRHTIRPNSKRRSTSSPLAQTMVLSEENEPEQRESFEEEAGPRLYTGRRSVAPRMRPPSAVVPVAALGSELEQELGKDCSLIATSLRGTDEEVSVVVHPLEREMAEQDAQTDDLPDTVSSALARQSAEHEVTMAEMKAQHRSEVDEIISGHEGTLVQLRATYQSELDNLKRRHLSDIERQEAKANATIEELEKAHERALTDGDAGHASAIAAALAAQTKTHDASISEARARHTQNLADQLAAHSAALTQLEAKHREVTAERERLHRAEVEKKEHRHQQALHEKTREHQSMIEDIHSTNDAFLAQRDAAYSAALKDRDEQVVKARAEIQRLQNELEAVNQQLTDIKLQLAKTKIDQEQKIKDLEAAQAAHISALAAANAVTEEARRETLSAQARAADAAAQTVAAEALAASRRQSVSVDQHDEFEDAVTELGGNMEEEGVRRVLLANLQSSGVQTDDESWAHFQQEQLALRPQSVVMVKAGETAVGPGGVTILGSQGRRRDSVGTFGGMYDRGVSPTPTSFSISAVELGTRSNAEVDKSRPPILAVPPPPSMPPPMHVPRRSNALSTTIVSQEGGSQVAPPRPTSPPPAKLLRRASRASGTLRPPAEGDVGATLMPPRTGSRASQRPPTSYVTPSKGKIARRSSNISGAGVGADNDSIGSTSILSRLSQRIHDRQASGASLASNVTSEESRLTSDASWNGRGPGDDGGGDGGDEAGDMTINARALNGPARRGVHPKGFDAETTDPKVIQAITQTMIGEYLFKYTRKTMGRAGHSDKRHRRYFWVHPYTKMLYWTIADPGGAQMAEGVSKSACIEEITVVEDLNPAPPGLHHSSILIQTAARELKLTAKNKERHEVWLNALGYLVNRNNEHKATADATLAAGDAASTRRPRSRASTAATTASRAVRLLSPARSFSSTGRAKSSDSLARYDENATPRARGPSTNSSHGTSDASYSNTSYRSKRRNTAAREYLSQASQFQRKVDDWSRKEQQDPRLLKTAEEMLEENEELAQQEGFESLDNVRACCGGLHDVGSLAHRHHIGQHQQKQRRGSLTPSTLLSHPSRPSSRLSHLSGNENIPATRPRASAPSISSSRVSSPVPQLGPLNLNASRRSALKVGSDAKEKQSLGSMFDMPAPATSMTAISDATRSKTPSQRPEGTSEGFSRPSSSTGSRPRRATVGEHLT